VDSGDKIPSDGFALYLAELLLLAHIRKLMYWSVILAILIEDNTLWFANMGRQSSGGSNRIISFKLVCKREDRCGLVGAREAFMCRETFNI
jgi:hypothetical protein